MSVFLKCKNCGCELHPVDAFMCYWICDKCGYENIVLNIISSPQPEPVFWGGETTVDLDKLKENFERELRRTYGTLD